jgi:hypothetical protein
VATRQLKERQMARKATNLDDARTYASAIEDPNVKHAIEALIKACETFVHDINVLYADVDEIKMRVGIT